MRGILGSLVRRLLPPSETLHGYENPELVDVLFRKNAVYEPAAPWPDMAGVASVLDFGGSFGIHYKQAGQPDVRWAIVETPMTVARAKHLSTDSLRFFTSIDDAANWLGTVEVMHSNGALQYVSEPMNTLEKLCSLKARRMLWSRLFLSDVPRTEEQVSHLAENGPGSIDVTNKAVSYFRTSMAESDFIAAHRGYEITARGNDWFQFKA